MDHHRRRDDRRRRARPGRDPAPGAASRLNDLTSSSTHSMKSIFTGAIAVVFLSAACAKNDAAKNSTAASSDSTFHIAMIAKSSTNPVFLSGRQGAEAAADSISKARGVKVVIDWLTPPNEDGAVQAQRIAQAVNDGDNAILLSASDAGKVLGAVNEAVDRGVPVMTFDSDVAGSKRFSFYGGDDA